MNVVFSVSGYLCPGGVQIVTRYLCEALVQNGHNVTVVSSCISGHDRQETCNGVKIVRFKEKDILKIHIGKKKEFQKYLLQKSDSIDCIITVCAQSFASEWVWEIQDRLDCTQILYMHGMRNSKIQYAKIRDVKHFFKEILLVPWWNMYFKRNWKRIKNYDAVIHLFENDSSYNYFEANGYYNNYVINNSCDDDFFESSKDFSIQEKYKIQSEYYICVANYDNNKNQIATCEAFKKAQIKDKDLVFIGSKETEYYKELTRVTTDSNIKILVGIPREATIKLIKGAYATVLSSKSEYFPLTIVEGMAAGKPFICTNVGVVPMIPGGVITHNINELEYWFKYYSQNPKFVKKVGEIARMYAESNLKKSDKVMQLESIIRKYKK